MRSAIGRLWREHRALFLAFALALLLTLFFALRTVVHALYWSNPAHLNRPLEPWMTPRYIARSYDLTDAELDGLLRGIGIDPDALPFRPTLKRIARERGLPVSELIARLRDRLAERRGQSR